MHKLIIASKKCKKNRNGMRDFLVRLIEMLRLLNRTVTKSSCKGRTIFKCQHQRKARTVTDERNKHYYRKSLL